MRRWRWLAACDTRACGAVGVSVYLAGAAIALPWDLPLLALAACSLLGLTATRADVKNRAPLAIALAVAFFLADAALSAVHSIDPAHSVRLSLALLPGALIFVVISQQTTGTRSIRALYGTWSAIALASSIAILGAAATTDWRTLHAHVAQIGSPLLLEANDVTLLAIVAPLSIALFLSTSSRVVMSLCAASLLTTIGAIAILQSRTASVVLIVSVASALGLLRPRGVRRWPRVALAAGVTVAAIALADASLGFSLTAKFMRLRDPRLSLWWAAWRMFLDAPLLGHGPHTFGLLQKSLLAAAEPPAWLPIEWRATPWAHNLYLEVLAEQGLLGLAALVVTLAAAVKEAVALQRHPSADVRTLAAAALAALAGFAVAGVLESSFLRLWVVLVFFFLLGVTSQLAATRRGEELGP